MLWALLLTSQAVPASLLAEADERNLAFVTCLFAVSRDANAKGLSIARFEDRLASSCKPEEAAVRSITVDVLVRRGQSPDRARAATQQAIADAWQGVTSAYANFR